MKGANGLLGIIFIFIVGNFMLVGVQKIWHSGDQRKFDVIKSTLEKKNTEIGNLKTRIHSLKSTLNQELIDGEIESYNSHVYQYNAMIDQYKSDIDDYNRMVQQANDLSKRIRSTWYIVPIPIHSK